MRQPHLNKIITSHYLALALLYLPAGIGATITPAGGFSQESQIIENPREPVPEKGQRKRIVFTEELIIGEAEGKENFMFGNSVQVNADSLGNIYVLDWDRKHIKKYAPDGSFVCLIGRQGQGPGEFGNIWTHLFDPEGNLYATDIVNKRISFFSPEGEFLKQTKIPENAGAVHILPDGNYVTNTTVLKEDSGTAEYTYVHGIYTPDFKLLAEFHRDFETFTPRGNKTRAEFIAGILSNSAFNPFFVSDISPDGLIYAGYPTEYKITAYDSKGRIMKTILKDHEPVRIGEKHKQYHFDTQVTGFLRGRDESLVNDVRKNLKYPKFLPAYTRFALLENGWLFVLTESLLGEPSSVDLFDAAGIYVGRFKTAVPCDHLIFRNGKAYTVVQIGDYNYVKRYGYTIENY